ncbi:MAG: ABC transporter permease [Oscillospiraceae bacterium]|nr:ABC transporter permease [Oscillospiraceae bacterium]
MMKFIALVKNEAIKLLTKVSSKIVLSLAIVVSMGVCLIFFISLNMNDSWRWGGWDEFEWLEERITEAQRHKYEGWEQEVAMLRFQIEHRISSYGGDWRLGYAQMAFYGNWVRYPDGTRYGDYLEVPPFGEGFAQLIVERNWREMHEIIIRSNAEALANKGHDSEIIEMANWQYQYMLDNDISPMEQTWQHGVIHSLDWSRYEVSFLESVAVRGDGADEHNKDLQNAKDSAAIAQYRLDNNVSRTVAYGHTMSNWSSTDDSNDVWSLLEAYIMLMPFMSVFVIIIAGGLVSSEFSKGTIKFLLINPVKRWKIITSKYAVLLATGGVFMVVTLISFLLFGGILTGFNNMSAMYLDVVNGAVTGTPALVYFMGLWVLSGINILVMSTLAFALSSLTRNSGLAIAISIAAVIGGGIIDNILRWTAGVDWGRYLLFANVDLVSVLHGGNMATVAPYPGQTLLFTIGVIAVHMVIFGLMAWDGFTRKEI